MYYVQMVFFYASILTLSCFRVTAIIKYFRSPFHAYTFLSKELQDGIIYSY